MVDWLLEFDVAGLVAMMISGWMDEVGMNSNDGEDG